MAEDNYAEKYTDPELRRKIKDALMQSDKGGNPGQWSARKSQLLVQEYERQGGGYRQSEKDPAARSLEAWTRQNWQTQTGEAAARQAEETKRYLPEAAWQRLSPEEREQAEQSKRAASRHGEQHADYPPAVKRAYREAVYGEDTPPSRDELYQQAQDLDISGRSRMRKDELQQAVAQAEAAQPEQQTRDELYRRAQELDIPGRSRMQKEELIQAIREHAHTSDEKDD
ncbi:MAG: Rho termination factor N-terminal domain-containing protein [Chloroflexaceae bacterium]